MFHYTNFIREYNTTDKYDIFYDKVRHKYIFKNYYDKIKKKIIKSIHCDRKIDASKLWLYSDLGHLTFVQHKCY